MESKVEIEDTMDVKRTSKNLKISVNKGAPPSVSLVTLKTERLLYLI